MVMHEVASFALGNGCFCMHSGTCAWHRMHSTSSSCSISQHFEQLVPFKQSTLHRRIVVES